MPAPPAKLLPRSGDDALALDDGTGTGRMGTLPEPAQPGEHDEEQAGQLHL